MASIDNLTLEELFFAHAPSVTEVRDWLNTFLMVVSDNADRLDAPRCAVTLHHPTSSLTMRLIIFTPTKGDECYHIKEYTKKALPANHPLARINHADYETAPSFVLMHDSTSLSIGHIPKTKEMLATIRHCLAKTGWPMFDEVLDKLGQMTPWDKLYVADNIRDNHPDYQRFKYYGRNGASLDSVLTSTPTDVPANSIKAYTLRELSRLRRGDYTRIPEKITRQIPLTQYLKEVPHLPTKDSNTGKIAYTENEKKGVNDVQSVMKPGKYLRRVLKDKIENDQHLKEMVAEMIGSITPVFHTTRLPKEAADVYMNGPSSCMSHGDERFHETIDTEGEWRHPIEALFFEDGSGDIELHYMTLNNRIAARALVNKNDDEYPSYYIADWAGKNARILFSDYLSQFELDEGALRGCKIPRIELQNGALLCPYIDHGNQGVHEYDDEFLVIGGPYEAHYEKGYVRLEERRTCDACDENVPEDETTYIDYEDTLVCDDCLENYPEALNDYGNLERMSEGSAEYLGFGHHHARYGFYFDHVADDISQSTLNEAGLCRDINGDIRPIDDCTEVDDEWVPDDEISDDTDAPEISFRNISYVRIDSDVYDVDECVWVEENSRWEHDDDVDSDEYEITKRFWYHHAERIEVDEDEAA
jgi:hypothetical protein